MDAGAALLETPETEVAEEPVADGQEAPEEVPSVFSVSQRYLVGAAEVSDPREDGSQVIRLTSASGNAVIEANLSPQLCEFVRSKLGVTKALTEDDESEVAEDAGPKE